MILCQSYLYSGGCRLMWKTIINIKMNVICASATIYWSSTIRICSVDSCCWWAYTHPCLSRWSSRIKYVKSHLYSQWKMIRKTWCCITKSHWSASQTHPNTTQNWSLSTWSCINPSCLSCITPSSLIWKSIKWISLNKSLISWVVWCLTIRSILHKIKTIWTTQTIGS